MILINEYENIIGNNIVEFACSSCGKPLQWSVDQMSPFNCYSCMEPIPDITNIAESIEFRTAYHLKKDHSIIY